MNRTILYFFFLVAISASLPAQVVINEGSEMNYLNISDEDGEFPDWIEIVNLGLDTVILGGMTLSDDSLTPDKWELPDVAINPGEFRVVFCSAKDRKPVTSFTLLSVDSGFTPVVGWNTHHFSTPLQWDGVSDILINTCSYSSTGYTTNSVFNLQSTPYYSTLFSFVDGSNASCDATTGTTANMRPVLRLNNHIIGSGGQQNTATDYPAPYGNWYWSARHQMLIPASELTVAGLTAGPIDSLSFEVISTDLATVYDYFQISMKLVNMTELSNEFVPQGANLHTNFKISSEGETIYLYDSTGVLISSLFVNSQSPGNSSGSFPDGAISHYIFQQPSPGYTNIFSDTFHTYLLPPVIMTQGGTYQGTIYVNIFNPNTVASSIHFTTDGTNPDTTSPVYSGPIAISTSSVIKASAFAHGYLPGHLAAASYLIGINHTTPILSVITDWSNLYGPLGIFDLWYLDSEREAWIEYFDTTGNRICSQRAGMQVDGGWGGSRYHPQHSFRVEADDPVLGNNEIQVSPFGDKPWRDSFGKFYLRNGSNQYLTFPHKDACQTRLMGEGTCNYYAAMEPVSVYINGEYFGLYEMREKFDENYFKGHDGATKDSVQVLSQSAWGGGVLRAVSGSVESFLLDYQQFLTLNPGDSDFVEEADSFFDMQYYTDYIIAESWMGNTDWPWNNIKIIRSDKTRSWRFCVIDLELTLEPNGWTNCYDDHINYMLTQSTDIPYINIWLRSMQNATYKKYFINRFADQMNTVYRPERLI